MIKSLFVGSRVGLTTAGAIDPQSPSIHNPTWSVFAFAQVRFFFNLSIACMHTERFRKQPIFELTIIDLVVGEHPIRDSTPLSRSVPHGLINEDRLEPVECLRTRTMHTAPPLTDMEIKKVSLFHISHLLISTIDIELKVFPIHKFRITLTCHNIKNIKHGNPSLRL